MWLLKKKPPWGELRSHLKSPLKSLNRSTKILLILRVQCRVCEEIFDRSPIFVKSPGRFRNGANLFVAQDYTYWAVCSKNIEKTEILEKSFVYDRVFTQLHAASVPRNLFPRWLRNMNFGGIMSVSKQRGISMWLREACSGSATALSQTFSVSHIYSCLWQTLAVR